MSACGGCMRRQPGLLQPCTTLACQMPHSCSEMQVTYVACNNACLPRPVPTFAQPQPCPAGSYCPNTKTVNPVKCPAGTFSSRLNGVTQSSCTRCPVNVSMGACGNLRSCLWAGGPCFGG